MNENDSNTRTSALPHSATACPTARCLQRLGLVADGSSLWKPMNNGGNAWRFQHGRLNLDQETAHDP
jgi:hypothetical protein